MNQQNYEALRQASLFNHLSDIEVKCLAEVAENKTYSENQTVFSFEHKGKYFYLIREGAVTLRLRNGKIRKYGPLESFGEIAIFNRGYRSGVIRADRPTVLISFHRDLLFEEGHLPADLALKISHRLTNQIVEYLYDHLIVPTEEIIKNGENERIEFKASIDPYTTETIMRTVVAFLNSKGGTIFIGVDDHQRIVGVNAYTGKDIDRFCTNFMACINRRIGYCFSQLITYDIEEINGKRVFRIDCSPANKPALLKIESENSHENRELFLVRSGGQNSTIKSKRRMFDYIQERFFTP